MKRNVIEIDHEKCDGCALCMPECPEGALQMIDGKARLVSDLFCDGLGACIGHCPTGAMTIVSREAEAYDEKKTMLNIVKQGSLTVTAHLKHLKDHGEKTYLKQAVEFLKDNEYAVAEEFTESPAPQFSGCPGSQIKTFQTDSVEVNSGDVSSRLRQWPVELHLVSPMAPYFQKSQVLIAADCTAFAVGDFHSRYLAGKSLAIACPKLDDGLDRYAEKITAMIDDAKIESLAVVRMHVPCCGGLTQIVKTAAENAGRKIPIEEIIVNEKGQEISRRNIS